MIYFVRLASGAIKIGHTDFLDQRLVGLRTTYGGKAELLHTIEGGYDEEQAIHERFAHLQFGRTEQFQPGSDLLAFIGRPELVPSDPSGVQAQGKHGSQGRFIHVSLSPGAIADLRALCAHPIAPFSYSAMLEHLITEAAKRRRAKKNPNPSHEDDDDQAAGGADGG